MSPGVGLSAAASSFTSLRRPPNGLGRRRWWRPIAEYGSTVSRAGPGGRLHDETDLPCFDLAAPQDASEAEKALAQLAGEATRRCKAVADHAKVVKAVASKFETAIKNEKAVPKTVLQATIAVGKTVGDYV